MFTILLLLNFSICSMLVFLISFFKVVAKLSCLCIGLKTLSSTCCFHFDSCNSSVFGVFAFASNSTFVVLIFLHPNMIILFQLHMKLSLNSKLMIVYNLISTWLLACFVLLCSFILFFGYFFHVGIFGHFSLYRQSP